MEQATNHRTLQTVSNSSADLAFEQIPVSILREHAGKWIIWDQEDRRVLGVGDTLEEAEEKADREKTGHLLRFHHASWTEMVASHVEKS